MRRIVILTTLLLTALVALGCSGATVSSSKGEGRDYSAGLKNLMVEDLSGKPLPFDQWVGNDVIVISFWATFCKPCKSEMPFLQRLHDTYGAKGLRVVGISLDPPDTESAVRPLVQRNRYTYPVAIDRQSSATRLLNRKGVLPFLLIFDRHGRLILKKDGFSMGDQGEIENLVKGLL